MSGWIAKEIASIDPEKLFAVKPFQAPITAIFAPPNRLAHLSKTFLSFDASRENQIVAFRMTTDNAKNNLILTRNSDIYLFSRFFKAKINTKAYLW